LIAVSVASGILIGNLLNRNSQPGFVGFSLEKSNKISTILQLVEQGYVDSVNTASIIEKTIPEILKNLDPHTTYIPARDMQEVEEEMTGKFSGIGVQFSIMEDTVRVMKLFQADRQAKSEFCRATGL
jgi:carboxyl-terminal processing protease